jgi:hypothetical protein
MRAMTTAAIIRCPSIPPGGLQQSMFDSTKPLSFGDLIRSPGIGGDNSDISMRISQYLIFRSLHYVHGKTLDSVFNKTRSGLDASAEAQQPQMPAIDILPANKTEYRQFGATYEDEGTIDGTYRVHDSLFRRQLQRDDKEFETRLWLVHGDQLTSQRIRTVKAEQSSAELPYDRREWMIGIPAWFHVQMNLLQTIARTHWAPPPGISSQHCLSHDLSIWQRTYRSRENIKYHQLEPSTTQSFHGRVVGLFYKAMHRKKHLPDQYWNLTFTEIEGRIKLIHREEVLNLVEEVRLTAFTRAAWEDESNIEFRTMCRFLQQMEMFLVIRYAVKHADIGLLRRMVDPLALMFFGAGQHNYGREMVYYRWLLSPASSDVLQRAILASGLVNWRGQSDTNKPVDLGLEHNNGSIKDNIQRQKNSTRDTDAIFDKMCLANATFAVVRGHLEQVFGVHTPDDHSATPAILDVYALAMLLGQNAAFDQAADSALPTAGTRAFDSPDLYATGFEALMSAVKALNAQNTRHATRILGDFATLATDADVEAGAEGAAELEEYVRAYQDEDC